MWSQCGVCTTHCTVRWEHTHTKHTHQLKQEVETKFCWLVLPVTTCHVREVMVCILKTSSSLTSSFSVDPETWHLAMTVLRELVIWTVHFMKHSRIRLKMRYCGSQVWGSQSQSVETFGGFIWNWPNLMSVGFYVTRLDSAVSRSTWTFGKHLVCRTGLCNYWQFHMFFFPCYLVHKHSCHFNMTLSGQHEPHMSNLSI